MESTGGKTAARGVVSVGEGENSCWFSSQHLSDGGTPSPYGNVLYRYFVL